MKKLIVLVMVLSVVFMSGSASAYLVNTTFEQDSAGAGTWDVVADNGWDDSDIANGINWSRSGSALVTNDGSAYEGLQCGRLTDGTSRYAKMIFDPEGKNLDTYVLTYYSKVSMAVSTSDMRAYTRLRNTGADNITEIDMTRYAAGGSVIRAKDSSGGYVTLLNSFLNDTWYEFEVTVNVADQEFDLKVKQAGAANWEGTLTDRGFYDTDAKSFSQVVFMGNPRDDAVYFDDIKVVPEPATLLILSLGSGMILMRRNKKQ